MGLENLLLDAQVSRSIFAVASEPQLIIARCRVRIAAEGYFRYYYNSY